MDNTENVIHFEVQTSRSRRLVFGFSQLFLTIMIPLLLTLASVRVVMSPLFLQIEYNRPGFPEDIYGFTKQDRLELAPYAVNYLIYNHDLSYLADMTFPGGERPLYTRSELRHMHDVQVVTQIAFRLLFLGAIATALTGIALWRSGRSGRLTLQQATFNGAILTLSTIALIVLFAITAWDFFFTAFHELFFEPGTWRFAYSDTLIRLFPEQFWFDASLTIGGLTVAGAVILLFISRPRTQP
jgi:integral membrane protein (TIGR01906 family)